MSRRNFASSVGFWVALGCVFAGAVFLQPGTARGQISLSGTNSPWSGTSPSNATTPVTETFSVSSAANGVLVVEVGMKNNGGSTAADGPFASITYGNVPLNLAISETSASIYDEAAIYYLYNPPASGTLSMTFTTACLSGAYSIDAFTLSGVNTTLSPIVGDTNAGTSTLSVSVTGVAAGSCAVIDETNHNGTGTVSYSASGTSGTITGLPLWTVSSSDYYGSGYVTNGGNLLTIAGSGNLTVSGALSGSGGLAMSGQGVLTLGSSNNYSGGTTLSAGTLNFGNAAALGSGTAAFTRNATLQAGISATVANNLAIGSGVTGTFDTQTNSPTFSGVISGALLDASPGLRPEVVPEPGTIALLRAGLVAGICIWRKRS